MIIDNRIVLKKFAILVFYNLFENTFYVSTRYVFLEILGTRYGVILELDNADLQNA